MQGRNNSTVDKIHDLCKKMEHIFRYVKGLLQNIWKECIFHVSGACNEKELQEGKFRLNMGKCPYRFSGEMP